MPTKEIVAASILSQWREAVAGDLALARAACLRMLNDAEDYVRNEHPHGIKKQADLAIQLIQSVEGTLAVMPLAAQADLTQWAADMKGLIDEAGSAVLSSQPIPDYLPEAMRLHLAAMPQPDVNEGLLNNLNTCAALLGDDYDLLDSKDDSHMAIRVKRVQEALLDARAAIARAEQGAVG